MIDYKSFRGDYRCHHDLSIIGVTEKEVTYCSFDDWLKLYRADPEGWSTKIADGKSKEYSIFPVYEVDSYRTQYIKFKTRRDYKRWISFMSNEQENREETDNLNELLELTKVIQARAEKAREESEAELKKLIKDNYALWRETVYENSVSPLPTKRARW